MNGRYWTRTSDPYRVRAGKPLIGNLFRVRMLCQCNKLGQHAFADNRVKYPLIGVCQPVERVFERESEVILDGIGKRRLACFAMIS